MSGKKSGFTVKSTHPFVNPYNVSTPDNEEQEQTTVYVSSEQAAKQEKAKKSTSRGMSIKETESSMEDYY